MEKTNVLFMVASSIYIAYLLVPHRTIYNPYASRVFFLFLMWQVAIWSHHLLEKWISAAISRRCYKNPAAASSISLIQLFSRVILFSILFLFTLSNLGIKITTIVAGLGVGGIAFALAIQRILGDLFSSLSIVLDKPFVVGDFIVVDTFMGEVEKIGLKTTRLRSLSGEQIIFSNSDLLGTRIRNYKRMRERRLMFAVSLPHFVSSEKVKEAVSIISGIIHGKERVRLDRCHLKAISSNLDIETAYWVLNDDYNTHMDIQQDILLELKSAFKTANITFAYPTQSLQIWPTEITMKGEEVPLDRKEKYIDNVVS